MPAVSIIVPNYNHASFLRRRIETILAQTFQDFELILLDDCSIDESRSILQEYASDPRVRLEFNETNSGYTFKQWNKGVRMARGKYVWIAESDDYADARFLQRLVPIIETEPGVVFVYSRSWRVTQDNQLDGYADSYLVALDPGRWTADFRANGREECKNYFLLLNAVPNVSAVLLRKTAYEQIGGADETLRVCGDWKLWASLMLTGDVAYVAEPLNYFRFHSASVRNKLDLSKAGTAEDLGVVRWILDHVNLPDDVLKKVYSYHAHRWVPAVLSMHVPRQVKAEILRQVLLFDPHPFRRVWHPAINTIRLRIRRQWRDLRSVKAPEEYANR